MSRADTPTLLPLDTYARIMGLNPLAFNQAVGHGTDDREIFKIANAQQPITFQYDYQGHSQLSRETLALAINRAEHDIATYLGWWPAPIWISQEVKRFPRPFLKYAFGDGLDLRGQEKAVRTEWGKVIQGGRRATTLLDTANKAVEMVFSDEDGDGFDETVTITITGLTITNVCEAKVYFAGKSADPVWEIRPFRSKTLTAGTLVIVADSWLFLDPDLQNAIPIGDDHPVIDADDIANYVDSVEVYREFTDFSQASAQFLWERQPNLKLTFCTNCSNTGCETCSYVAQDGCLLPKNPHMGLVSTSAAEYDSVEEVWNPVNYANVCSALGNGREPDIVKLWYYAGFLPQRYLDGTVCNPLSLDNQLAHVIAYLATARLDCDFNANNNVAQRMKMLQRDHSESFEGGSTFFVEPSLLDNPFGTRLGELRAYKTLKQFTGRGDQKRIGQWSAVAA